MPTNALLIRTRLGELIFQQIKEELQSRGYSMTSRNFPADYPISRRAVYLIRRGVFTVDTLNKLPGVSVEEWFSVGAECQHTATIGRDGETGSWCVNCGIKVLSVETRRCRDCKSYKDGSCSRFLMRVSPDMLATYKVKNGTCFAPKYHPPRPSRILTGAA